MPEISLKSKLPSINKPAFQNLSKNYGKLASKTYKPMKDLTKAHVESFNWFLTEGLKLMVKGIDPIELMINGKKIAICLTNININKPKISDNAKNCKLTDVYPTECRQRSSTYNGKLHIEMKLTIDGQPAGRLSNYIGPIPIMVQSKACNLKNLTPKELVAHNEECNEMGGYFIVNGNEKVMRLLIMQRRNYPLAINRPSFVNRGLNYSAFGVSIRSMTQDQSTANSVFHYLVNGTVNVCLFYNKEIFFFPLMLIIKSLVDKSDSEIVKELTHAKSSDSYYISCMKNMLRQLQNYGLKNQHQYLAFIGSKFRVKFTLPEWYSDKMIGEYYLRKYFLIHLEDNVDKFRFICLMVRKLFDVALGKALPDNPDSIQHQEVLTPGHLFTMVLKEKLELWLYRLRQVISKKCKASIHSTILTNRLIVFDDKFLYQCLPSVPDVVSQQISFMLATGNLSTHTGLGLMQFAGLAIIGDKLNFMRYVSHFRCVHRGAFFSTMRTTGVRKLLPESWGFICPVHTPDGNPCGLMNHMSYLCEVVNEVKADNQIKTILYEQGISHDLVDSKSDSDHYPVLLNGKLLGWLASDLAQDVAYLLRKKKALGEISSTLEVCLVPHTGKSTQYPGLYLFDELARLIRPVWNIETSTVEMIGTYEQVYLNICITEDESHELTTHQELSENSILSVAAAQTPFSDFNQSPRNMYQCQMGKQTMGTPCHSIKYRADNKLYWLETPQTSLVRPFMYDHIKGDDYAPGTNAIVAVISYTGYDMEDAMIINKGSFDRGFSYGCIYKTETIDLAKKCGDRSNRITFGVNNRDPRTSEMDLGSDGLPYVGQRLQTDDAYYSYVEHTTGEMTIVRYRSHETAYVDSVRAIGNNSGNLNYKKVSIVLRVQRNPTIGDKFASRHGQKGVCSQMWPTESMPFTEGGMVPDIIFNPHGFPSRMTIGMMIESMAGKSASMHGHCYDATPFNFNEDNRAIDHFGKLLVKAGYNYHGTETMYSGVSGLELEAKIFVGVVYYQRLRHMVSDKFQVRTTGPVDALTQQPVGGRKRHGGVRFGEMERDALLAHGCAMLIHDRLLTSSDYSQTYLCRKCGSLLSPHLNNTTKSQNIKGNAKLSKEQWICKICETSEHMCVVDVPFVYLYLINEFAAMNIKTVLKVD